LNIDFSTPETIADPFPALHHLLEHDPIHWNQPMKSWCLTRYHDVSAAYQDPRFSADRIRPFVERQRAGSDPASAEQLEQLGDCIGLWLVFNDPPTHTRLRKLTAKAFNRRSMLALRPNIERLVDELIDQIIERGEMDFVRDFAYPLPANVIADLLGVPREHVEDLKRWSDDLAQFVLSSRANPEKYPRAAFGLQQMNALFGELIRQRRRRPGDDVIDLLIAASDHDDHLSETELLAFCVLLLFAGHETTTHFFANGLRALLLHPEQLEDLRSHLDQPALVMNALHEMLRWDGPVIAVSRLLAEDIELDGKPLRRGERAYLFSAAANRDPDMFAAPERFDIRRREADRMLSFGFGLHLCLGIHLARLEGAIGFPRLLRRLQQLRLSGDDLQWTDTMVIRGPKTLPVRFE
jgi:cytochrome P450